MSIVVITFLWVSILLYIVLGGADFGTGIVELVASPAERLIIRQTAYRAIGPIWEANHMWLIIAVVILFVGFPVIYTTLSIYLHLPLVFMLLGIMARGTAFACRNYDAVKDYMQGLYNRIFVYSSAITPFFLGIIAGSMMAGRIDTKSTGYLDAYVFSWLHGFSLMAGLFTTAICGFLAAVYMIGEAKSERERQLYFLKTKTMLLSAIIYAAGIFFTANVQKIPLIHWLFSGTPGIVALGLLVITLFVFCFFLVKKEIRLLRLLAVVQVTLLYFALTYNHINGIVLLKNGHAFSLIQQQATSPTIKLLGFALLSGSVFIIPALLLLLYRFEKRQPGFEP